MEVKNPSVENKTIGSHTVFMDKNRKIVFIPSKDDDDSGNDNNDHDNNGPTIMEISSIY